MRALALSLAALAAAACTNAPQSLAAEDGGAVTRTITVNGEGMAAAAPDLATIQIGVQTEGASAGEALRANSEAMNAAIDKLKALKIDKRDIQTAGLSVNPKYDYGKDRSKPIIIGYVASNTVSVRVRDIDKVGSVIDQTVAAGANSLSGVSFGFADPQPLYDEARTNAVKDARSRAKLLADAAGVKLGPLQTIQDGYARAPTPQAGYMRMEADAVKATPVETGESTVTATVTLIYAIE